MPHFYRRKADFYRRKAKRCYLEFVCFCLAIVFLRVSLTETYALVRRDSSLFTIINNCSALSPQSYFARPAWHSIPCFRYSRSQCGAAHTHWAREELHSNSSC